MVFVKVVKTPERGRGLVVTEAVSAGTLLLAEPPFALSLHCRPPPPSSASKSSASQSNLGSKGLLGLGQGQVASTTDAFGSAVVGRCHACLAEANSTMALKRCPKCHLMEYCSRACQAADWRCGQHRLECACLRALGSNWPEATPSLRLALKLCARIQADSPSAAPSCGTTVAKGTLSNAGAVSPSAFISTKTERVAGVSDVAPDHLEHSTAALSTVTPSEISPLPSSLALASTLVGNRGAQPPERLDHFSAAAAALVRFQALAPENAPALDTFSEPESHKFSSQVFPRGDGFDTSEATRIAKAAQEMDPWINVLCALACNTFSLADAEMRPMPCGAIGIYPQVATINHSCAPNAVAVFHARGELQVRALRPLVAGEEVTLGYTELRRPTRMRQRALLASHCFTCKCTRCDSIKGDHDEVIEEEEVSTKEDEEGEGEHEDSDIFGGFACPHRTPSVDSTAASMLTATKKSGSSLVQGSDSASVWDAFFGHVTPSSSSSSSLTATTKAARSDPRAYEAVDGYPLLAPLGRASDVTVEGPRCNGCLTARVTRTKRRQRLTKTGQPTTMQSSEVRSEHGMKEALISSVVSESDPGSAEDVSLELQDEAHMYRKWQAMQIHDRAVVSGDAGALTPNYTERVVTGSARAKGRNESANTVGAHGSASKEKGADAAAVFRHWAGMEVLPDKKAAEHSLTNGAPRLSPAAQTESVAAVAAPAAPSQAPRKDNCDGIGAFSHEADEKLHLSNACLQCGLKKDAAASNACMKRARILRHRAARVRHQQRLRQQQRYDKASKNFSLKARESSSEDDSSDGERNNEEEEEEEEDGGSFDDDDDEVRLLQQVSVLQAWCFPRNHWRRTKVDERLLGLLLARGDWVGVLGLARGLALAATAGAAAAAATPLGHEHASGSRVLPPLAALHMLMLGKLLWWLYQDPPQDPRTWAQALLPTAMEEALGKVAPAATLHGACSSDVDVGPPAPAALLAAAMRCLVSAQAGLVVSHGASHLLVEEAAHLAAEAHAESDRMSTARSTTRSN